MTYDYKRHDTTTLFAALNVLNGQVIGQCQQRHTHVQWLKFLRQIDRETPKDKTLRLIADHDATHKHPVVRAWLAKHPRFNMHFTPTLASWLNMVERFFRNTTTERLRRGVFPKRARTRRRHQCGAGWASRTGRLQALLRSAGHNPRAGGVTTPVTLRGPAGHGETVESLPSGTDATMRFRPFSGGGAPAARRLVNGFYTV